MKKILFLLALGAVTPVWAQDVVPVVPVQSPASAAPFKWRLNLRVGQKWLTTTDTSIQMTVQPPVSLDAPKSQKPVKVENTVLSHMVVEQKVLSSDDKGARIEVTYRDISQSLKMSQNDHTTDKPATPSPAPEGFGDISKSVVGARISYLLSPSGQISDIQGVEDYLKRFDEAIEKKSTDNPKVAATLKPMRATMAGFMSPEIFKTSLGNSYQSMPKAPVERGKSWSYSTSLSMMGVNITEKGQNTFVSRAGSIVTIAEKLESGTAPGAGFNIPVPAKDPKTPASKLQMNMQGTSTGQILVDEITGLTVEHRSTQTMRIETVMGSPAQSGKTMTMEMKSETTIKTQQLDT